MPRHVASTGPTLLAVDLRRGAFQRGQQFGQTHNPAATHQRAGAWQQGIEQVGQPGDPAGRAALLKPRVMLTRLDA